MATKAAVIQIIKKRPIIRGVFAYAIIWPTSNLIQQSLSGTKFTNLDWAQAGRFSLFGSCYVAPTLYCWIRFSSRMWPRSTFKTALHKAIVEQFTYGPFAMISFFFGMSLLEGKTLHQSTQEVRTKFLPTYQMGVMVWPILQTINFRWISEKNRVPYVSVCSLGWTCFLAYMKQIDAKKQNAQPQTSQQQVVQQVVSQPIILKQLL